MGVRIVRYAEGNDAMWGVVTRGGRVAPVAGGGSLAEFLEGGAEEARRINKGTEELQNTVALDGVRLLSPVTAPSRIVAQGTNYQIHRDEASLSPDFNLLFAKADSSISGPNGPIVRPRRVELLDYEVEMGLVIGRKVSGPVEVAPENVADYVAGIVLANDVSARDVQIPEGQWFKGKSYRTFLPLGPYLYLLDPDEGPLLERLELKLWVNGELRQRATTDRLVYGPAKTLAELSGLMDLAPGDLVLTGTPGGVALKVPGGFAQKVARLLLDERRVMKLFVGRQRRNPRYLKNGDVVRAEMRSTDGRVDLGTQENVVVAGA